MTSLESLTHKSSEELQFSCSAMSDYLWSHGLLHARLPGPSLTSGAYSNWCPSCQWCHPTISSSAVPFSSHLQSFPASRCFKMSQLFASGGRSIGLSASVAILSVNIQDWSPLGGTGWISLPSQGLSSAFSSTRVQKHQILWRSAFFTVQLSHPYMTGKEKSKHSPPG